MKIGWVGLGKLGLPCALALAQHHDVFGYDVSDKAARILAGDEPPMQEEGLPELLDGSRPLVLADSIYELVEAADVVFVAVQTPHLPKFSGERPMHGMSSDFSYGFLAQACHDVCRAALILEKSVTLVVVSTVLPGTTDALIRPLLNSFVSLVYSPQFIAMGTTIRDFTDPEFVICGVDSGWGAAALVDVFTPVHGGDRLVITDIVTAESIKVYYNTFISLKIVWANHIMELCHKTGADCDVVVDALSKATDRIISPAYMRGGMGDGGACHPRDLIALSWLEQHHQASYPLFGLLVSARERQTEWIATKVRHYAQLTEFQVIIMGKSYKPGSDLTAGSPALLLQDYLQDLKPWVYDPHTRSNPAAMFAPSAPPFVYVIATKHPEFAEFDYRPGSVIIDPFGFIRQGTGCTVIPIGRQL